MKNQIDKEDLERLERFVSTILSLNSEIKYQEDLEIEKSVRHQHLVEKYGDETFQKVMYMLKYTLEDLLDEEKYAIIQVESDKLKK